MLVMKGLGFGEEEVQGQRLGGRLGDLVCGELCSDCAFVIMGR